MSETRKYLVIHDHSDPYISQDIFQDVYDSLEEANKAAADDWYKHLTPREKKFMRVSVWWVTKEMLSDAAFDDEGNVEDWAAYRDLDRDDDCFDSARLEENNND